MEHCRCFDQPLPASTPDPLDACSVLYPGWYMLLPACNLSTKTRGRVVSSQSSAIMPNVFLGKLESKILSTLKPGTH